jgi:hypothetical protein
MDFKAFWHEPGGAGGCRTMTADQEGSVPHEETAHARTSTYDDPTEDLV